MKNPWMRFQDIANSLGLLLGAFGIVLIGMQMNNIWIIILGILSSLLFLLLFSILLGLFICDYIELKPYLKRSFLGIRF